MFGLSLRTIVFLSTPKLMPIIPKIPKIGLLSTCKLLSTSCTLFKADKIPDAYNGKQSLPSASHLMSTLRFKSRPLPKKKRMFPAKDAWSVVGYATAEGYDLLNLNEKLVSQGLYDPISLEDELTTICLCATAKYNIEEERLPHLCKDIYFFGDGTVVFWNIPELERETVLTMLRQSTKVELDPYEEEDIYEESEMMNVKMIDNGDGPRTSQLNSNGVIQLVVPSMSSDRSHSQLLEQYAFSNAIASSVKLGMLEATLDKMIDSIEFLSDDLKAGRDVKMSQQNVLKKSGEIFALRHVVNLSSDLLDTPDFYWDRETLEALYHTTCAHLAIGKRTRVMNEKLTHMCELMELIRTHLSDKHHVRLEWFIIALIWVEVIFECLHFAEKFI